MVPVCHESHILLIAIAQVEDTLFRVHRRYFEQESEVFRAMFQLPVGNGVVADGSSDEQPLRLEGVKKEDFRQLLRIMFPECVNSHRCVISSVVQSSSHFWTAVLSS